ncbi:MAG: HAMP domain-containing sensor histidine kinase [Pseudomonadota bacterium]
MFRGMRANRDPSATVLALLRPFPKATSGLQADVYLRQQILLTKQQLQMGFINTLAALLVAVTAWGSTSPYIVGGWTGLVCFLGLLQVYGFWRKRSSPEPKSVSGSYLKKAEYASLFAGVLWGSTSLLFQAPSGGSELTLFLYVMHAGMAAGVASIITPLPRHVLRFSIPCLMSPTFAFMTYDGDFAVPVTIMSVLLLIALTNSSIMSYKQFRASIARAYETLQATNTLSKAINASNDTFAFYGQDGQLVLANDRHKDCFSTDLKRDFFGAVTDGARTVRHQDRWLLRSVRDVESGGTVIVHTDVTGLKQRERELVEARREAEEADKAKGRFLSTMSHELRQPLHVIIGNSTLMSSGSLVELQPHEVQEYADDIHIHGEHLLRLIDDIIDYSKVGLDRFRLKPSRIDVRAMIAKSVSLAAQFEGVRDYSALEVSVSPKLRELYVDEFVTQRILISLLSNAFRHGGNSSRLAIKARLDESGRPYISVRDFGSGLSEDDLKRVFEPFYQKDNSLSRETSGAGLGLTISRHLARLQDGDVILKSRIGAGTNATIILPPTSYINPVSEEKAGTVMTADQKTA